MANPYFLEFFDTTSEVCTRLHFRGNKKDSDLVMCDSELLPMITTHWNY